MTVQRDSFLLRLVAKFIKYFALALFAAALAFVLAGSFGLMTFAVNLLPLVFINVLRLALLLFCLIAVTVIVESLR
jgi:hypothetical protein